jgi:hypothetical protein
MSNTTRQSAGIRNRLDNRLPTTPTALGLLVGDLFALFGFLAVGQYKHGYLFWEYPSRTLLLLSPLVFFWVVLALPAGLLRESSLATPRETAAKLLGVWLVVAILNGLLRRTVHIPGYAPPSFFAVSFVFGLLFVGGWRLLATKLLS